MTLLGLVQSLGDRLPYLSRIVIETGPGRTKVQLHFAGGSWAAPLEMHDGVASPLGGPRRLEDARPDGVIRQYSAAPDERHTIETANLDDQIEALHSNGIVGGINIERLGDGRKIVVSTHAATQKERNTWLAEVSR